MRKLVVLVDMDEVLVDLVTSWMATYHELGGEKIEKKDIRSYNFETSGLVQDLPLFWKALDRAPAMRTAKPLPGAIEALRRLSEDHRYDTFLVTYARHESWGRAHEAKLAWLWQHAPWFDRDRVIFTRQKHLVDGDFLVEDNAETCAQWVDRTGGTAYLVNQPWNADCMKHSLTYRVASFADVVANLLEDI